MPRTTGRPFAERRVSEKFIPKMGEGNPACKWGERRPKDVGMENKVIKATRRSVIGKQVKALRRQGQIPAVLYGYGTEPIAVSLDQHAATLALTGISASTIVTVSLDGKEHAALVRERQKEPVKATFLHVDFQVISLTQRIRAAVQVEGHGVSTAVKNFNAVIVNPLTSVDVEALPGDMPERIIVDLAVLENIGDAVYVRDLAFSDKVQVLTPVDELVFVATGSAPEAEEITEEAIAEPEVIERGKKDEDEE